jgi:hypothetical protein
MLDINRRSSKTSLYGLHLFQGRTNKGVGRSALSFSIQNDFVLEFPYISLIPNFQGPTKKPLSVLQKTHAFSFTLTRHYAPLSAKNLARSRQSGARKKWNTMSMEQKWLFVAMKKALKLCCVSGLAKRLYTVSNLAKVERGDLGTSRDAKSTLMFSVFAVFTMECVPPTAKRRLPQICVVALALESLKNRTQGSAPMKSAARFLASLVS